MNKIEITIPEGFEIDQSKSDLSKGIIELKPVENKKLSYGDLAEEIFHCKPGFYLNSNGLVSKSDTFNTSAKDPNNATSKEQLECLMAYNKLRNVAEYLNKENLAWGGSSNHYYIIYRYDYSKICIMCNQQSRGSNVYFNSEELAQKAIDILGEEEIKKALFINET